MPKFSPLYKFQALSSASPAISPRIEVPRLEEIKDTAATGFVNLFEY
jgi:hypothetical protein